MKKITSVILIIAMVLSTLLLSSCGGNKEESLDERIERKTIAYRTDILDSAETLTSNEKVQDYLENWAASKNIEYTSDAKGNIIMHVDTTEMYREAQPTVVVCAYDYANITNCADPMSTALYLIKNNEETGDLTVIFTPTTGSDFTAFETVSTNYFPKGANVFNLSSGRKKLWSANSGAVSTYKFTGAVSYNAPEGNTAYKITISGLPGGTPDSKINSYPNPIKELSDFIAKCKTNALIFEITGIEGGISSTTLPTSATMTMVIDENSVEKFQTRIDKAIEKFNKKYNEDFPDVTFTYEQTELPQRVMSKDSLNSFISTTYALVDGVYYRDESNDDVIVSISSLGSIAFTDSSYVIQACGNSLNNSKLTEIDQDYETICGLSNVTFERVYNHKGWQSDPESDFANEVMTSFKQYSGKKMEYKDCVQSTTAACVFDKNPECNIMNVVMDDEKIERYTGTIVQFLMNQPHSKPAE